MIEQFANLLPLVCFVSIGIKSVIVDLREHRLPNLLTIRLIVAIVVAQIIASLILTNWIIWIPVFRTLLFLFFAFIVLYLMSRGGLGMGDVKFVIPCALVVGWYSPNQWLSFLWFAFGMASIWSLAFWIRGAITRQSSIAFGPCMFLAVIVVAGKSLMSG